MATSLAFVYAHMIRYFAKGIDQNGPFYRVEYDIGNWSDTDAFINALLGAATVTGGPGGTVVRISPHQHPLSPNLYCQSAEVVEGVGKPLTNVNGYPSYAEGAIIRAEYRAPRYDIVSNPNNSFDPSPTSPITYATQELDFGTETYTIANNQYLFSSGPEVGKLLGIPARIQIPLTTMVLTFERLPYIPMVAARAKRGRVNSSTFLGAAAGLVLFEGCRSSRSFNTDGSIVQSIQMVFKERDAANPWNSMPSRRDATWYPVEAIGGAKLFLTTDLTPLIQL